VLLWFDTLDPIVRGLSHGLNNRALALSATIESLDSKRPVGQQLASGLSRETERLTEQLRQLRTLPFAIDREPMPLLLRDVLTAAMHLHRAHATLGDVPVYVDSTPDAPPVLAPESPLVHASLVTLTALKRYAAPGGLVRVSVTGTPEMAEVHFVAQRDPGDAEPNPDSEFLVRPASLASALLSGAQLEIDQRLRPDSATVQWSLPSLRAMRRRAREAAAPAF
jgi:hypothetical protein